ncbi:MAG TPA: ankyrin repeat domain-containing protein [Bryobacteraceae bacterium]|jgi:ankyrin repeat protein|nr:ankyrin repeat domain-containing protein [Bryobacteraceae bacterium]
MALRISISLTLIALVAALFTFAATSDTRLADAAQNGDRAAVRSLLAKKVDVNAPQGDGTTALHWAAFNDDADVAKLLLAAGANVKAGTRVGAITPLFLASKNGSAPMIELLLKAGADANSATESGTTALMMAASAGNAEALKVLIAHGANVNARDLAHGQTALIFAASLNRADAIKILIANGADPSITSKVTKTERVRFNADGVPAPDEPPAPTAKDAAKDPAQQKQGRGERGAATMGGQTALLYAARDGQIDAARALVEAGADVNQGNAEEKTTPLVMAIINGHYDLGKMLLDHGADPNIANIWGLAALYATIDVQWAPYAWFPQPITSQENITHLEMMKALIAKGADVNAKLGKKIWVRSFGDRSWADPVGATPFWRAAQSDDVPAMKLLVAAGADPKIATAGGDTALMVAAGLGWAPNNTTVVPDSWKAAVEYCMELGLDVNAVDAKGYTAMHGVAFRGDNDLVKFLVAKGAKTDVKTKTGDTIADMANGPIPHSIPHPDTVALLESLGSANSHNCRSDQCLVAPQADTGRGRGRGAKAGDPPAAAKPATPPVPHS